MNTPAEAPLVLPAAPPKRQRFTTHDPLLASDQFAPTIWVGFWIAVAATLVAVVMSLSIGRLNYPVRSLLPEPALEEA